MGIWKILLKQIFQYLLCLHIASACVSTYCTTIYRDRSGHLLNTLKSAGRAIQLLLPCQRLPTSTSTVFLNHSMQWVHVAKLQLFTGTAFHLLNAVKSTWANPLRPWPPSQFSSTTLRNGSKSMVSVRDG